MQQPNQIFISYARPDASFARQLSKQLISQGWTVFLDENVIVGSSTSALEKALRKSDWYVVLLSKDSVASPNINFELGAAMAQGKPVIPVYMSRSVSRDVPAPISGVSPISAEGQTPSDVAHRIARTISRKQ